MAAEAPAPAAPLCDSCPFFVASKLPNAQATGTCKRFPTAISKDAADWCGEHPRRNPPLTVNTAGRGSKK